MNIDLYSSSLSDYRLLGLVGQGEFAQVYCAVHRRTGRLAAIKQIRHTKEPHTEKLKWLPSQEAAIHQPLEHPRILKCHAASRRWLILDYCESGTLRSHLSTAFSAQFIPGHLSFSIIKRIVEDLLQGLDYLHQNGIVHSDLKPENILLTTDPANRLVAKISDFGCAHFLEQPNQSTTDIGSPFYTAPERFDGYSSIASDLYSVGVIIYELLVGDRPFSGTPQQLRYAHQSQPLSFPPTLSVPIQQLLSTALHKEFKHRFPSALNMLSAFQELKLSPVKAPAKKRTGLATVNFYQKTKPVAMHGIAAPIDSLTALPQGCGIVTANSLHILTQKGKLTLIARFKESCWISVAPTGKWFVALPRNNKRSAKGMVGRLYSSSRGQRSRGITPTGRLLTTLLSQTIQVVAIDARYFLKISTAQETSRTYIECFTTRGQYVGELRLNQTTTQIAPTAIPYQLVALGISSSSSLAVMLMIDLKPFQVRTIRLPFAPRRIHALAWGYLVTSDRDTLVLDRNAQPVTLLEGLPKSQAIASLNDRQLLLADYATQPALSVVDVGTLNLGLIF